MSQARPALTVDVNMAGPKGRNINGKAAAQARASSQAPSLQPAITAKQHANAKPGEVITEEELIAQGGFSSDEEPQDSFSKSDEAGGRSASGATSKGVAWRGADLNQNTQMMQEVDGQYIDDSEESDDENYGQGDGDIDMGSEDDEGMYDEDEEDELSSSPSIPDENIDFDLVYALHNFIATVEGQATVNKGNSLTLLDDSNSYWWLVRVLRTQEVGYIPAENIETPFERLARLNKHRNVDLTSATDDDHIQVPEKIYTSHLVKQRSFGVKGFSSHSGKLSALSQRSEGPSPSQNERQSKRGVQFGPPTYLEHSGNELSDEEEYEDEEEYDEEEEEEEEEGDDEDAHEDGDGEEERSGERDRQAAGGVQQVQRDESNVQARKGVAETAMAGVGAAAAGVAAAVGVQGSGQQQRHSETGDFQQERSRTQQQYLNQMEPDDGMDWDAQEAERVQRAKEERNAARAAADQRRAQEEAQWKQQQQQQQQSIRQQQQTQQRQQQQPQQQYQQQQRKPLQLAQNAGDQIGIYQSGNTQTDQQRDASGRARPLSERKTSTEQPLSSRQRSSFASPDRSNGYQGAHDRSSSDASNRSQQTLQSTSAGRASPAVTASPDSKRDKRSSNRKSKSDDDFVEEKQPKKRSGVFSGLFSRSKDKKERKSGSFSHQRGGSGDNDSLRSSEDSSNRRSLTSYNQGQATGLGRAVQEKDRAQQEAYQRQFLQEPRRDQGDTGRPARPGSLIGTPSTVPMLNVLRVFAGNDIDSDATFKTVLLNETTTARDLVRQAMQRFRLDGGHEMNDYVMTVKLVEGDERILNADERPLQVFDQLTEMHAASNRNGPTIPRVKRSSIGSISSISSNLSLNPAIARLGNDFSDDHDVKFYLNRRATITHDLSMDQTLTSAAATNGSFADISQIDYSNNSMLAVANDSAGDYRNSRSSHGSNETTETIQSSNVARFALRLLIFPSDLPEGIIFDPQTNALIPERTLAERGSAGLVPSEGVEQTYREKILALPRNTTVAEVIEQGLDRFGIMDGVVEGGDDVEERTSRRKSKGRVRYGLCIDTSRGGLASTERSLTPMSKVLDSYPSPPVFRAPIPTRRGAEHKRRSQDSAMLLSLAEEISPSDPIFILRQIHTHKSKTARALSPSEDMLVQKQDQQRQAERESVGAVPSANTIEEARMVALAAASGKVPAPTPLTAGDASAKSATRQEIITAQRAAAKERRAAILGAQRNDEEGVDVVLDDQSRIRSAKVAESGRMRYSFIPAEGQEQDISAIVEDVLQDQRPVTTPTSLAPPGASRPGQAPRLGSRMNSTTTLDDYESAPTSPGERSSPLSLREVHLATAPLQIGSKPRSRNRERESSETGSQDAKGGGRKRTESEDVLDSFVRNPQTAESTIEDRIDQVLSRVGGGQKGESNNSSTDNSFPQQASTQRSSSSRDTASPISGSALTHQSSTTMTTPLSTIAAGVAGAAGAVMSTVASTLTNGTTTRLAQSASTPSQSRGIDSSEADTITTAPSHSQPFRPLANTDFGLDHLYAVVEAAARKKPTTTMTTKQRSPASIGELDYSPTDAGLFPPPAPIISDRRVKEVYSPIGKHLNSLEDSLDQLLKDVLHTF